MSKGKFLAVCVVWLLIVAALAASYRLLIHPLRQQQILGDTDSDSQYKHRVNLALDSFSGYAILRSSQMKDELAKKRIRLNLIDDQADYKARLQGLRSGQYQLAVFTIGALLNVSAELGEVPATIVGIIDESRGADAVVAYKEAVPNIDALNRSDMKFVLTTDSPSETLARVVMAHFNLDNLPANPIITATDSKAVYDVWRSSSPTEAKCFVVWEPYVTKILENPNTHILADSSKFRGYIVDVLVAERDYLRKNEQVVLDILGCYFRAAYHYRDSMVELVLDDARRSGEPLSQPQAENLVQGIWWKNTQENFAHFGLQAGQSTQLLEDMIDNITRVLLRSHVINQDPTKGQPTQLFFDKPLQQLQTNNFHPGLSSEQIRDDKIVLPKLTAAEWERLVPIGTLNVEKLVFARGTDQLIPSSKAHLDDLVGTLNSLPQAYVRVLGNASKRGDAAANKALAGRRAATAEQYLIAAGIDPNRVRSVATEPSGATSVSFVLGQPPY